MAPTTKSSVPFWRQPLLHFTLLGFLIFAWHSLKNEAPSEEGYNIIVTEPQIERMVTLWSKTWERAPTDVELNGLIQDYIKEEIYYREAQRLELDKNDIIIRRRLRQKMEFLSAESINEEVPDQTTLLAFYEDNQDKYKTSAIIDLEQVYYKVSETERAKRDLVRLNTGEPASEMGNPISLPREIRNGDETKITRLFGSKFWEQSLSLKENEWAGPITSGFGLHLVKVNHIKPSRTIAFDQVMDKVESDLRADTQIARQNETFERLKSNYKIEIDLPQK